MEYQKSVIIKNKLENKRKKKKQMMVFTINKTIINIKSHPSENPSETVHGDF